MRYLFLLLFLPFVLFADKVLFSSFDENTPEPWTTGPLLAPSGNVVPLGDANYEPYIYVIASKGFYDNDWKFPQGNPTFWSVIFQPTVQVGLTSWLDFQIDPELLYNYSHHQAKWRLGDLPVGFDIQLYSPADPGSKWPAIKLALREEFPTGKYDHLDPFKLGTDAAGLGSYQTSVGLVASKLWHLRDVYFFSARFLAQYTYMAPVRVKGFNTYGGSFDTDAKVYPRPNFYADLGVELTLSQNWVLACDISGTWWTKSRYKGNPGHTVTGALAPLGVPSAGIQYAVAPAIEYNWSAQIGLIAGAWVTFAGKNAPQFSSGVIAFNYYQ